MRLWRPQWSAQRQRRCKYHSPLSISSATTNRVLYIRTKNLSTTLNFSTSPQSNKRPLFKPLKMWKVHQSWYCSPMCGEFGYHRTQLWGTKIQGPRVAFVFLGKGISAQHATNTRDDATKHRSQQKPPETNGFSAGNLPPFTEPTPVYSTCLMNFLPGFPFPVQNIGLFNHQIK